MKNKYAVIWYGASGDPKANAPRVEYYSNKKEANARKREIDRRPWNIAAEVLRVTWRA